jgi:hypothetical protein
MRYIIPELPEDNFDWITWRNGAYVWLSLGFRPRRTGLLDNKDIIRNHAVGYIPGEKIWYRYKPSHTAIMFLVENMFGWTHLRNDEFNEIFHA